MKSNKGITLISLIIYIIVLSTLVGVISMFTKNFYRNVENTTISNNSSEQYVKFLAYLTEDINSSNLDNVKVNSDGSSLNFSFINGEKHQYLLRNNSIYYITWNEDNVKNTQIRLCGDIETSSFEYTNSTIEINITINNIAYKNIFSL